MVQDDGDTGPLFGLCARPVGGDDDGADEDGREAEDGYDERWCKMMVVLVHCSGYATRPVKGGGDDGGDLWCKIMIVVLIITFFFFPVGLVTT